jgi:DNA-binding beta-propeller fold protein YncE
VTRASRIACLLAALAITIAGVAIFTLRAGQAQESAAPASPRVIDFTPRSIPPERRTTMSQGTEVVAGVDAKTVPQFQVDPFWPKPLPNNWLVGQVAGVHVDKRNHVWIIHRPASLSDREVGATSNPPISKCCFPAPPVLEFDQEGNLVRYWGGAGAGYEWPASEHGIYVDNNDFVWIGGNAEKDSQILKFTLDGKFVLQIGKAGQNKGSNDTRNLGKPAGIQIDEAAREVYVADGYGNRRVIVFDSETGAYKRHWGAYGKTPSDAPMPAYNPADLPSQQFGSPVHCVRFSKDNLVYVCDRINNRYQVFRKDGTFVSESFFEKNTLLNGSVSDLVLSTDPGQMYIFMVDGVNSELRIVDRKSAKTLARIGRPGRMAGQFHVVHNIAVDSRGNLYTTEVNTGQRVQKFRRLNP